MIDLNNETLLSFAQAAQRLPATRGQRVHASTILRWARDGARLPSGRVLKLEALKLGGRYITSTEALERFGSALMTGDQQAPSSQAARNRAHEEAEAELDRLWKKKSKK